MKETQNNILKSFGKNIIEQTEGFLDTVHGLLDPRASLVLSMGEGCSFVRSGNTNAIKHNIELFKCYPELKRFYAKCGVLWSRGYFISSVGHISEQTVRKYIEEQKNEKE